MTHYLDMQPQPPEGAVLLYKASLISGVYAKERDSPVTYPAPVQPAETIQVPTHGDDSFDRGGQVTHYMVERKVVSVEPMMHDGRWQWKVEVEPAVKK